MKKTLLELITSTITALAAIRSIAVIVVHPALVKTILSEAKR